MESSTKSVQSSPSQRIVLVDAMRGFALAGIVITHMLENYIAAAIPMKYGEQMNPELVDQIISGLCDFLLRGKFFALFSFLFGLSFFIQMDNAAQKGKAYGGTFLWRTLILLGIGYLHSCLYRGDILLIYALLAIPLIPFYKASSKILWAVAAFIFLGGPRYLLFHYFKDAPLFVEDALMPESPASLAYIELLQTGSPEAIFSANAWAGILNKFEFQWGVFSRGYLTFGFFVLGLLAGRMAWFKENIKNKKRFQRGWIFGLGALIFGALLAALFFMISGEFESFNKWTLMFGLTAVDLFNLGLTIIIVSLFVLAYATPKGEKRLAVFAPYGRMALTNYLLQSVVGSFIYYSWGLAWVGTLPSRYSFLMALGLIVIQMAFSSWWLKHFRYGPVEWLWRSLTHFKRYPLRFND